MVKDYLDGTFNMSQAEKVALQIEILLEAANFQTRLECFGTDMVKAAASGKSDFDFWTVASHFDGSMHVAPLAQKLLSCYSAMGAAECVHKITARQLEKYSNRKLDPNTEAYCEIAIAESNKRLRENTLSRQQNVMEAFSTPPPF